ncbi:uncharacterized protein OCT59_015204 [Rhizophagus irregularis]|uniref:uncharacterized protein n=1 Tax=Rhizophagus irregularis TaxID=588596 RepID=UPI003333AC94|nr:hypothetical protein OCT59_015204 [Rhizophagus irregularis]
MEEIMLSGNVIDQIKDFYPWELTEEQSLLIDKLILNEELKKRFKNNGLCKDCKQPKASRNWCQFVLKCLHNSQDITADFLGEIESHTIASYNHSYVVRCYGITKDPISNDFIMVMFYAENGSLRQLLNDSFNSMKWEKKLDILTRVASGLKNIHEKGLIHHDFHCDIIKQCWDADPLKRPKANELYNLSHKLYYSSNYENDHEINKQIEESDKINEKLTSSSLLYTGNTLSYTTNPQAVYTSRLLDFKNLPEPKNSVDNKDDDNSFEYSESMEAIDFTKLDLGTHLH